MQARAQTMPPPARCRGLAYGLVGFDLRLLLLFCLCAWVRLLYVLICIWQLSFHTKPRRHRKEFISTTRLKYPPCGHFNSKSAGEFPPEGS
ncbi:hypothetical protein QBC47DRAFT_366587 [Echria macrotheca]|uniref:Uncharacterized protein n=1 Tax=Echria macrotheca TaxID=438768 RepID=A0AAJ0BLJ1_9PEZI|nr:hypothetical protein QBC47DRAFT_366587 [Echria macrotheca]